MLDDQVSIPFLSHTPRVQELKRWLQDYCGARIDFALADERKCLPPHVVLDFGNKGLFGLSVSPSDGGMGLSNCEFGEVISQLGAIDPTLCLFVGLSNVLGIRPLEQFGQEALRSRYLQDLAAGRLLGAFALTEPAAGSAPQAMLTTARWSEGDYVIDGTKHWIGNASWCGVLYVFARTIDESGAFIGITCFAVDRGTPGLRIGPEAKTLGMHATAQSRVVLDGIRVSPDCILGELGGGLEVAQDTMMRGRLVIAAATIGAMKRCAILADKYANRRRIATGLLGHNPVTKRKLADFTFRTEAAEHLVFSVLDAVDREIPVPPAILAACKIAASELLGEAADDLIQLLGGRGYIEPNLAPRIWRDARILRVFEGPTETLLAHLGSTADHSPGDLVDFAAAAFPGSGQIERALSDCAELKTAMAGSSQPGSSIDRRLLMRDYSGRLLTWALLDCAQPSGSPARNWIQRRYACALAEIRAEAVDPQPAADHLRATIAGYREDIGDADPLVVGEDGCFDPYLSAAGPDCENQNRGDWING